MVLAAYAVWSLDEPPPDVSDLVYEPSQLTDDENAYVQLSRVAQHLTTLNAETDFDELDDFVAGEAWNEVKVSAWLAPLDPIWPEYEAAARLQYSQGVIPKSIDTPLPEIGQMMRLAKLSTLRARIHLRADQPDKALSVLSASLAAGRLIQESRSTLISYLTGVTVQSMTLKLIQEAARHPDVSPTALREAIATLQKNRVAADALGYAFRSELYFFESAVALAPRESRYARLMVTIPGLYKPNKTRRIYAEYLRGAVRLAGSDLAEINASKPTTDAMLAGLRRRTPENIFGRMLLQIVMPTLSKIAEKHLRHASEISITQALIAVRIHEKQQGALPASLADLTPAILPSTPKDYYDGADIKYSRDSGFIWSVGSTHLNITSADQRLEKNDVALRIASNPSAPAEAVDDAAPTVGDQSVK